MRRDAARAFGIASFGRRRLRPVDGARPNDDDDDGDGDDDGDEMRARAGRVIH